tara:strand:- start:377 stop:592 length:216 start_codon:yes stop_codon:yes gene_type:complete
MPLASIQSQIQLQVSDAIGVLFNLWYDASILKLPFEQQLFFLEYYPNESSTFFSFTLYYVAYVLNSFYSFE